MWIWRGVSKRCSAFAALAGCLWRVPWGQMIGQQPLLCTGNQASCGVLSSMLGCVVVVLGDILSKPVCCWCFLQPSF